MADHEKFFGVTQACRKDTFVTVNVSDGSAWVSDNGTGEVVKLLSTGTTEYCRVGGFNLPNVLDVNYIDRTVWVPDYDGDVVIRLGPDCSVITRAGGFKNPVSASVNPLDGTCWVSDHNNHQIVQLSPDGTEIVRVNGFDRPVFLSITPDEVTPTKYPTAEAIISSHNIGVNDSFTLTCTGTDPDGTIVFYEIDSNGDGEFDYSSENPLTITHSYGDTGIYNPVCKVTDNEWLTAHDYTHLVRVGKLAAHAGALPTSGNASLTVSFSAEYDDPIDGVIDNYQWDFEDDGEFNYFSQNTGNTTYTYKKAGTYTATLKVTDGPHTAIDKVTIEVLPSPPAVTGANAAPDTGVTPLTVNFTAAGNDPDGEVVLYFWDFDGDNIFDWQSTSSGTAVHTYTTNGTYNAQFKVTDNDNLTDTEVVVITVGWLPPIAVANAVQRKDIPLLLLILMPQEAARLVGILSFMNGTLKMNVHTWMPFLMTWRPVRQNGRHLHRGHKLRLTIIVLPHLGQIALVVTTRTLPAYL